jgi:outer membrane usher protein
MVDRDGPARHLFRLAAPAVMAVALGLAGAAWAADQALELEVVINGYSTREIGDFVRRDGALLASGATLAELGFKPPPPAAATPDGLFALSAIAGLTVRIDEAAQTLYLQAAPDLLSATELRPGGAKTVTRPQSGLGATLDYDLVADESGGRTGLSSGLDFRIFSSVGVFSSTALAFAGAAQRAGEASVIRLDTAYIYSDFDAERQVRAGDVITGGLTWTRPVRLGGGQLTHDFVMRPDLITFPLPGVTGAASVPSTVNVLLNGAQLFSTQVKPGPFSVSNLPVISGAGVVQMNVTNALGQQVTTTLPFYASTSLLAPGLSTYALEAGAVRRNWGLVSNDYGPFSGSATWRRGLSDRLTLEAHAEGTQGQAMAGAGVVVNLFNFAVANLSAAVSTAHGAVDEEATIGIQRLGRVLSFGAQAAFAGHGFRDIAAMEGEAFPYRQLAANLGVSLGRRGSFGLAYAQIDSDPGRVPGAAVGPIPILGRRQELLTANYSVQVRNIAVYATGFHDFTPGGSKGVTVGLTIPLGPRRSAALSVGDEHGGYAQAQLQQSVDRIGDFGYQLLATDNGVAHGFAQASYKAGWGLVTGGVDAQAGITTVRAELQGALSLLDHALFVSNSINDSFAVVDTGGIAGVDVLSENRVFGRTDAGGRLLIPDLRAYQANHLSVNPDDLPPDATITGAEREVRPADRSGVVVRFPIRRTRGALVVLVDEAGKPLPLGSFATLAATGATVPVGYDGEAFVEDLAAENRLTVARPDGTRCRAAFAYRAAAGEIPKIGPIACAGSAP